MEDIIPQSISVWLLHYGSFALFVLLMLGIFALPVPDEALLVFSGALISQGKLNMLPTLIAGIIGACCGITLSYLVGRTAGIYVLQRFGKWVHLTEANMLRVHYWFERFGCWALSVGYFIPGVRHLTGYAAGMTDLEYPRFALFAYSGATVWAMVFLSVGYFLGVEWVRVLGGQVFSYYFD